MLLDAVHDVLSTVYGARPASLREGEFCANDKVAKMFNVLFDSGALHHSYISKAIVDEHRDEWESRIEPYEAWVKLADQKTVIKTKEVVKGVLSFVSDGGTDFSGEVEAIVWDMKGLDFILGLPDIVKNFINLFFLMLKQNQVDMAAASSVATDVLETTMKPGEVMLWSDGSLVEAPEEVQCPLPVGHEPILNFMETTREEALEVYFNSLKEHVGEHLKDCKELWDLLRSEVAVNRFVPHEW